MCVGLLRVLISFGRASPHHHFRVAQSHLTVNVCGVNSVEEVSRLKTNLGKSLEFFLGLSCSLKVV